MERREAEHENLARSAESLAGAARDLRKVTELVEAQREAGEQVLAAMQQFAKDQAALQAARMQRALEAQEPGTLGFPDSESLSEDEAAAFAVEVVREVREELEEELMELRQDRLELAEAPSPDEVRRRVGERHAREE